MPTFPSPVEGEVCRCPLRMLTASLIAQPLAAASSEVLAKQFKRRFDLMRHTSDDQRFVLRHIGTYYRL
jgi:hypothetical protein